MFRTLEHALDTIHSLRPLVDKLKTRDDKIATQIRNAANSYVLNLGEGNRRTGRDRTHHFRMAAGSAEEVRVALRSAYAWGHLGETQISKSLQELDQLLRMIYGLTR